MSFLYSYSNINSLSIQFTILKHYTYRYEMKEIIVLSFLIGVICLGLWLNKMLLIDSTVYRFILGPIDGSNC